MTDRLIILGASCRAAAFSALRAGFQPYTIDLFADRDLTAVCTAAKIERYPQDFLEALAGAPQAPWMYTGGLESHPKLVDKLAEIRPLLGNCGDTLKRVRRNHRLARVVRAVGCHFPSSVSCDSTEDFPPGPLAEWLWKPRRGSGGLLIRRATRPPGAIPGYWQRFIAGESGSAVFVGAGGCARLLGVSRQLHGHDFRFARPFLYVGSLVPWGPTLEDYVRFKELGDALARHFDLVGLFNVDFIRNDEGLWVLEVNARYSASMEVLERLTEQSCVGLHVAACAEKNLPPRIIPTGSACAGKAVVYAKSSAVVLPAFDDLVAQWNLPGQPPGIADLPRIGQAIAAGEPVATVLAEGHSLVVVEAELRSRVAAVLGVLDAAP